MNFKIINLNKDTNIPVFEASWDKKYIKCGKNDDYFDYLLDVYHNRSNKHKAIIERKAKMIGGNGIMEHDNPSTGYINFLKNIFSDNSVEEIIKKISYDLEIFDGFSLKIRWSRDRSKISSIDYLPFHKVRKGVIDDLFYLSNDWKAWQKKMIPIRKFTLLPFEVTEELKEIEEELNDGVEILYFMSDQPGCDDYPIPYYSSTLTWIETDWEISNYHYNSVLNGFTGGFLLSFNNGIPTDEEQDMAYKDITNKLCGTTNGNKVVVTYSDGIDNAPTLSPIELNATDDRYMNLANQIKEEIFIGHQVTSPMLFGVRTEGQLGGRDELMEAMELFQSSYINDRQKIIEDVFNRLLTINDVPEKIKLKKYDLFRREDN